MTYNELDEMRAGALSFLRGVSLENRIHLVKSMRATDEAAGIPTEGLLALMRGEAVIVPVALAKDMEDAVGFMTKEEWRGLLAASPWAKKSTPKNTELVQLICPTCGVKGYLNSDLYAADPCPNCVKGIFK